MTSPAANASSLRFPSARVTLPILVLLGYLAFLVSGFGTSLGVLQPLPIYIFFSLMLLMLQISISENRSIARIVYIFVTSGFAIIYAGEVIFGPAKGNFTRSPYTYIVLNTLLFAVFVYDAVDRRRSHPEGLDAKRKLVGSATSEKRTRMSPISYGAFATDFAGLAILYYIAAFLIDLLGRQRFLHIFGVHLFPPYVIVDVNQTLGLHLGNNLRRLEMIDLVVAFGATAVSLLLLGIVGVQAGAAASDDQAGGDGVSRFATRLFGGSIRSVLRTALNEVMLSLRLVLGPLVWLIPAFSIANFAWQIVTFLNISAQTAGATILDLFNPLSEVSRAHIGEGIFTLSLGAVAFGAVIVAVTIVEYNKAIIQHTLHILIATGRTIGLTMGFFLYSLAALNAFAVLALSVKAEPFQVGAPGLLALLAGIGFAVYTAIRGRKPVKTPVTV